MDSTHEASSQDAELEAFQRHVADRFHDLSAVNSDELISIPWLRKLLDTFLCCQEEFRAILFNNKANLSKSPMEKDVSDYFERSVKALDVCNAIRDGIEQIKQWQKQLEIVLCALDNQRNIGEGQFRRAKKVLLDLALGMLDDKESSSSFSYRNRSFGRNNMQRDRNYKVLPLWTDVDRHGAGRCTAVCGGGFVGIGRGGGITENGAAPQVLQFPAFDHLPQPYDLTDHVHFPDGF